MNGKIPEKTHFFSIDETGNITNTRFTGDFQCQILNVKNRSLVDKHRAFLNGEYADQIDGSTLWLHQMISHLRFVLIGDLPRFWRESDLGYELFDTNVIKAVYDATIDFENEWFKEIHGADEDSSEESKESKKEDAQA